MLAAMLGIVLFYVLLSFLAEHGMFRFTLTLACLMEAGLLVVLFTLSTQPGSFDPWQIGYFTIMTVINIGAVHVAHKESNRRSVKHRVA